MNSPSEGVSSGSLRRADASPASAAWLLDIERGQLATERGTWGCDEIARGPAQKNARAIGANQVRLARVVARIVAPRCPGRGPTRDAPVMLRLPVEKSFVQLWAQVDTRIPSLRPHHSRQNGWHADDQRVCRLGALRPQGKAGNRIRYAGPSSSRCPLPTLANRPLMHPRAKSGFERIWRGFTEAVAFSSLICCRSNLPPFARDSSKTL